MFVVSIVDLDKKIKSEDDNNNKRKKIMDDDLRDGGQERKYHLLRKNCSMKI